ncbi:MAG: hypothetical protein ACK5LK_10775 [Chthoniobacterales bacterium]
MRIPYFLIRWYYGVLDFIRYRVLWPGDTPIKEDKSKKDLERETGNRLLHVLWVFIALIGVLFIFILFTYFPEVIAQFFDY